MLNPEADPIKIIKKNDFYTIVVNIKQKSDELTTSFIREVG